MRSYFVSWSAVVFKTSGATAVAQYKAHRGSSFATAASTNSQRKLVADGYDVPLALGYESGGEIWLAQKDDQGNWNPEWREVLFPFSCGFTG